MPPWLDILIVVVLFLLSMATPLESYPGCPRVVRILDAMPRLWEELRGRPLEEVLPGVQAALGEYLREAVVRGELDDTTRAEIVTEMDHADLRRYVAERLN